MPRVTVFQHIDCEGPGTVAEILSAKGVEVKVLKPFKLEAVPEDLGNGLIVLGGPMGVREESLYPWMTQELNAIRKCLEGKIPFLGVCLGSQMLAHAAGGQVLQGALPEVGWFPITLSKEGEKDRLLNGLPSPLEVFHWHGDTFTLPPNAVRLASSEYYPNQVVRIGPKAYGFQCHLEVTAPMVESWITAYGKELVPQGGPIKPERITDRLEKRAKAMRATAETVFGRFAEML